MAATAADSVKRPDREALQQGYVEAWNAHDPDAVASFFTEDATYDDRGAAEVATGRAEIRDHAAAVMAGFPDLRFEVVRTAHGDRFSAAEWRAEMTHAGSYSGLAASGRKVVSEGVDVATLDDAGKVTHLVSHYDGAAIMRQLGLLPAHGSRPERALVRAVSLLRGARRIRPTRT